MNMKVVILLAIVATVMAAPQKKHIAKRQAGGPFCTLCKMLVKFVEDYAEEEEPQAEDAIDQGFCDQIFPAAMDQVCRALVHQVLPQIVHIIETDPDYTPESVCGDDGLMMC